MSVIDNASTRQRFLEADTVNRAFVTVSCILQGRFDVENKTPAQVASERIDAKKEYLSELLHSATRAVSADLKIAEAFKFDYGVLLYKIRFKDKWKALKKSPMYGKMKGIPWQDFEYVLDRAEMEEFITRGVSLEKVYALSGRTVALGDVLL